jgi:F0F1-type ATP synthase assembly protein I
MLIASIPMGILIVLLVGITLDVAAVMIQRMLRKLQAPKD